MRCILGVDTASRFGSIALARDGAAESWEVLAPREHSSELSGAAERLLRARGLDLRDVGGIAVSGGPGSFTGLRIGLAWAKGVCFAAPMKLVLVSAHEATAHRHRHAGPLLVTLFPGERGEAQVALWSGGERVSLRFGPERVSEEALAEVLRGALSGALPAAGDAASCAIHVAAPDLKPSLREALLQSGCRLLDEEGAAPLAAAVAELGDRELLAGNAADLTAAAPFYGRAPNARRPGT